MKTNLLPKSRLGSWSVGLITFALSVFVFFYITAELLDVITSEILITIFGSVAIIASLIAFVIGIVAVTKNKEKSFLVYLAILVGFIIILFIFGDIFGNEG